MRTKCQERKIHFSEYNGTKIRMLNALFAPALDLVRQLRHLLADQGLKSVKSRGTQTLKRKIGPSTVHAVALKRQRILSPEDFQKDLKILFNSSHLEKDLHQALQQSHFMFTFMKNREEEYSDCVVRVGVSLHNLLGLSFSSIDMMRQYVFRELSNLLNFKLIPSRRLIVKRNLFEQKLLQEKLGFQFDPFKKIYFCDLFHGF
eukprot:Pompholyxophrys_punicea_v1_NODE_114_length_3391_cov_11.826439.p2 type:complete len:203 gc:universal NODE_114_length_3391_cov_11.826439:740-132(-)